MNDAPLQVEPSVLHDTFCDLRACLPGEGVGLWAGQGAHVLTWLPLQNVAVDPQTRYAVHPEQWLAALRQVQERGQQPLAIVHSHPTTAAVPSRRDRAEWHYPELWCVIVSFAAGEAEWMAYHMKTKQEQ